MLMRFLFFFFFVQLAVRNTTFNSVNFALVKFTSYGLPPLNSTTFGKSKAKRRWKVISAPLDFLLILLRSTKMECVISAATPLDGIFSASLFIFVTFSFLFLKKNLLQRVLTLLPTFMHRSFVLCVIFFAAWDSSGQSTASALVTNSL